MDDEVTDWLNSAHVFTMEIAFLSTIIQYNQPHCGVKPSVVAFITRLGNAYTLQEHVINARENTICIHARLTLMIQYHDIYNWGA